ncbi:MAG: hypothetical protein ACPGU1_10130 [Myxococcota bacterium]
MTGSRVPNVFRGLVICVLAFSFLTVAPSASAADKRNPKVIELEGIDVIGKVAKPQVFYVLGRSTVRYEQLKLDQSFVTRIVAAARANPF